MASKIAVRVRKAVKRVSRRIHMSTKTSRMSLEQDQQTHENFEFIPLSVEDIQNTAKDCSDPGDSLCDYHANLCDVCKNTILQREPSDSLGVGYQHQSSMQNLEASSDIGCYICEPIWKGLGWGLTQLMEEFGEVLGTAYGFRRRSEHSSGEFSIAIHLVDGESEIIKEYYLFALKPVGFRQLKLAAMSSEKQRWTGSLEVAAFLRAQLARCIEVHGWGSTGNCSYQPTRLLDISGTKIRLVAGSEITANHPYATLSHCWGSEPFLVLEPSAEPRFQAGLQLAEFPKTFQDAMLFTRNVGARYIWIDRYCILQGDTVQSQMDWANESSNMGDVYRNAIFNLGSEFNTDAYSGLFHTRDFISISGSDLLPSKSSSGNGVEVFQVHRQSLPIYVAPDEARYPLFQRGWVLQEDILCRRMLTFGRAGISFQCQSGCFGTEAFPETASMSSKGYFWILSDGPKIPEGERLLLQKKWLQLLSMYSRSQLSFPSKDRLKAVESVGLRIAELTNDDYRHGILLGSLPQSLCWAPQIRPRLNEQTLIPMCPSWHWAAVNGPIYWIDSVQHYTLPDRPERFPSSLTEVLCFVNDTSRPIQPFGIPAYLLCIAKLVRNICVDHAGSSSHSLYRDLYQKPNFSSNDEHQHIWTAIFDTLESMQSSKLTWLALLPLFWYGIYKTSSSKVTCLLLRQTFVASYRRLGRAEIDIGRRQGCSMSYLTQLEPRLVFLE